MAKALTLLQPWASLIVMGAKKIETRSWRTNYRGELLIHASKKFHFQDVELCHYKPFIDFIPDKGKLPTGAIIGKVDLVAIEETNDPLFMASVTEEERKFGNYNANRYGWILQNPVMFAKPIPTGGALSIWEFDFSSYCTSCGSASDCFRTAHAHNVNGTMVHLIKEGERLCRECVSKRGLPTLSDINEERKKAPLHSHYHEQAEQQHRNQKLK